MPAMFDPVAPDRSEDVAAPRRPTVGRAARLVGARRWAIGRCAAGALAAGHRLFIRAGGVRLRQLVDVIDNPGIGLSAQ